MRVLDELCTESKLAKAEKGYCVPNFVVKLPSHREKLMQRVAEYARKQGYGTFSPGTFWKRHAEGVSYRDVEKVLDHLHEHKKVVRLNDGRFLTVEALDEIMEKVRALIVRKGHMTIEDGKHVLGYGRNRAVPVLDYLDSIGFTRRIGDERVLTSPDAHVGSLRR